MTTPPPGSLFNRCIEDVRSVQFFAGESIVEIVQLGIVAIGVVAILFLRNPLMALISLLPLIPMVMMTTDFGQRITRLFYDVDNTLGDLSARLQENVSGVQVVRAFAREPYEITQFDTINRSFFKARIRVNREWAKGDAYNQLVDHPGHHPDLDGRRPAGPAGTHDGG